MKLIHIHGTGVTVDQSSPLGLDRREVLISDSVPDDLAVAATTAGELATWQRCTLGEIRQWIRERDAAKATLQVPEPGPVTFAEANAPTTGTEIG